MPDLRTGIFSSLFKYKIVTIDKIFTSYAVMFLEADTFPKIVSKSPATKNAYFKRGFNTKSNICIIVTTFVCIKRPVTLKVQKPSQAFPGNKYKESNSLEFFHEKISEDG